MTGGRGEISRTSVLRKDIRTSPLLGVWVDFPKSVWIKDKQ